MEVGNGELSFLDFSLIKSEGRLISNWYRKPTFSGRFLNFYSQYPMVHKKGTIINLIDEVTLLSHPKFHKENLDFVLNVLLDNDYPLQLIFSTIKRRLHYRLNHNSENHKKSEKNPSSFFTIPYVSSIANKFVKYFKNIFFIKLAFTCYNKLNKFIKIHKDILLTYSLRPNVV